MGQLPGFVIIGAQKAATTTLWHQLGTHPEIGMSQLKETNFFVEELGWSRGLDWYRGLFPSARVTGEASPNYTMYPSLAGVPQRMAGVVPDAKLIYLVRHPIDRMVSSYVHGLARGFETRRIEDALTVDSQYLRTSCYASQIDRYREHFPPEHLLVLTTEELNESPQRSIDRIMDLLGLDSGWLPDHRQVRLNETVGKRAPRYLWRRFGDYVIRNDIQVKVPSWLMNSPITNRRITQEETTIPLALRRNLIEALRPDLNRLRSMVGSEFDAWGLL